MYLSRTDAHLDDGNVPRIFLHGTGVEPPPLTELATQFFMSLANNAHVGIYETPMEFVLRPWHLMLISLACWLNRQQRQEVLDSFRTENAPSKMQGGTKRSLSTVDQRRGSTVADK